MCYAGQQTSNYSRGDYYRGDYYRGDLFGSLLKGIGGAVKGFVTGGPVGAIGGAISAVTAKKITPPTLYAQQAPMPMIAPPLVSSQPRQMIDIRGPFGTGIGLGPYAGGQAPVGTMLPPSQGGFTQACGIKGTRPNKSGYYKQRTRGNPADVVYIPKGSVCVKTRRMNVANARALRRSIRRAQGFAKMARRVMTFVSARAPKGRAKFRRRK